MNLDLGFITTWHAAYAQFLIEALPTTRLVDHDDLLALLGCPL